MLFEAETYVQEKKNKTKHNMADRNTIFKKARHEEVIF